MIIQRERELRVGRADLLIGILRAHGVNVSSWGHSATKTPDDLLGEIRGGETVLVESKGQITRKVSVAGVDVFYKDGSKKFRLIEERQVFRNGGERRRIMKSSVSEKLKAGENPKKAAERGVREELGLSGKILLKSKGKSERQHTSPSYPGLGSRYVTFRFETWLNSSQYKPEGYVEDDGKKQTFFAWKEV